jgi:hypothetical protein
MITSTHPPSLFISAPHFYAYPFSKEKIAADTIRKTHVPG